MKHTDSGERAVPALAEDGRRLFKSLCVQSTEQFAELNMLIHDEFFSADDITHDPAQRTVHIPYRRIFHGGAGRLKRNWFIYRVFEVDVIRSVLTFHNVDRFTVTDATHIRESSFNIVQYDAGRSVLTIRLCEGGFLEMHVSDLLIESRDIEIRGKARISYLFGLLESNSSRVYD